MRCIKCIITVHTAPGRRWTPWETASIRAVDTVGIGLLRVWYGDSTDPRFPAAQAIRRACPKGWLTALRSVSQPTPC